MEAKVATLEEKITHLEKLQEEAKDERAALLESVQRLTSKIERWEGKFGGFLFAIGCLWAFFSGFAKAALNWLEVKGGFG